MFHLKLVCSKRHNAGLNASYKNIFYLNTDLYKRESLSHLFQNIWGIFQWKRLAFKKLIIFRAPYFPRYLHVFKSVYSFGSIPNSPKCKNTLTNCVDNTDVENSSIFPNKRVRQCGPNKPRGIAAKLVDVVDGGAHVLCSLNDNHDQLQLLQLWSSLTSRE